MRATLARSLRYEFVAWRAASWPRWIIAGAVAVSAAVTVVAVLASRRYLELADGEFWAVVATQGGPLDLPPMYGYVLAMAGVLAWRNDVAGDSAHVAYTGFAKRWPLVAVRTVVLVGLGVAVSLAVQAAALGVAAAFGPPTAAGQLTPIAVKTLWVVIVGVAFTLTGAALSMLTRSTIWAFVVLLVVPWIVEPLLSQVLELSPALHAISGWGAYFPFTMLKDALGDPSAFGFVSAAQLGPRNAASGAVVLAAVSVAVTIWRYCTADGTSSD